MIRSILYATDLGLYSAHVLQHAISLAKAHSADLYIVHAVEPLGLFAESVLQAYLDETLLKEMRAQGLGAVMANIEQRVLDGFRDELDGAEDAMSLIKAVGVVQGDPPQMILEEVQKLGVDLLVLGSHSHGALLKAPLGRTASRLMQLAQVPVYLVPMLRHRGRGDV
ncbi:universal stress protein [Metapseudomonas otitidis]|uniref:universal stress protein n=1 Tax=Metapseudomonas otitidis TaxID=319939 RepID=UPI0025417960|nr:universal stress protein [Pseudomonas otitidis]WIF65839.1 universal stress protein [Pseudomonas otitidis]